MSYAHALLSHLGLVVQLIVFGLLGGLPMDESAQLVLLPQLYLKTSLCCVVNFWLKREIPLSVGQQSLDIPESMFVL